MDKGRLKRFKDGCKFVAILVLYKKIRVCKHLFIIVYKEKSQKTKNES